MSAKKTKDKKVKKPLKNRARILLVEDEKDMAYTVTLQLEAKGYEVIVAEDGQAALQKARTERPNIIILDIMLPKLNGYKVCRMLKFDDKYKNIPIIMFTARAQDADKEIGREVGADAYITKPFEPEVLLEKISELLKQKG
ncbi:response regulator transcription factor [Candidatus Omnitrophota bacterium]